MEFGILCLEGQYKVHAKNDSSERFYVWDADSRKVEEALSAYYTLLEFRRFRYRFMIFFSGRGGTLPRFLIPRYKEEKKCGILKLIQILLFFIFALICT